MNGFLRWLTTWSAGDVVSLVALLIAIWQIRRARSVAEQVGVSVREVRQELERRTTAVDLTELIRDLEEIKDMHRSGNSAMLPKRYTAVRMKLASVRTRYRGWSSKQKAILQDSMSQFSNFENRLDSAVAGQQFTPKDLNSKANAQIDKLVGLLSLLENEKRRTNE